MREYLPQGVTPATGSRPLALVPLLAVLAFALATLVVAGALNPWKTEAQSLNCSDLRNPLRLPLANCTFTNTAVHPVNDIHIVFSGVVVNLSSVPSSQCTNRVVPPRQGGPKTLVDCRFGTRTSGVQPSRTFSLLLLYAQPGGPNIDSWYWTRNGTPVTITPTGTGAVVNTPSATSTNTAQPTRTNTPQPTSTNTPSPTPTNTAQPTRTNTPVNTATATATATNSPSPTATDTPTTAPDEPTPTDTPD